MANFLVDRKQFGLTKEAVRGTVETAPAKWLYVARDAELAYSLEHAEMEQIGSQNAGEFAPEAGRKVGKGKFSMDLEAQTIGEVLNSLLGGYTGTQVGTTTAYTHTFTKTTAIDHPAYTLFVDRGVDYFGYNMGVCKSLEISLDNKGRAKAATEWLFKSEQTRAASTATHYTPDPLMFYQAQVEIDDTTAGSRMGALKLKIDNGAEAIWRYGQSQDCDDIIVAKRPVIEGGFDMYFTSTAERADYLANTSKKIEFNLTGDLITGSSYFKMLITLPACKYTAVPFDGEKDGLLGASVAFKSYFQSTAANALNIVVGNVTTTY